MSTKVKAVVGKKYTSLDSVKSFKLDKNTYTGEVIISYSKEKLRKMPRVPRKFIGEVH